MTVEEFIKSHFGDMDRKLRYAQTRTRRWAQATPTKYRRKLFPTYHLDPGLKPLHRKKYGNRFSVY